MDPLQTSSVIVVSGLAYALIDKVIYPLIKGQINERRRNGHGDRRDERRSESSETQKVINADAERRIGKLEEADERFRSEITAAAKSVAVLETKLDNALETLQSISARVNKGS